MSTPQTDRNLMVGVVALQLSLISDAQLVAALKTWSFNKSKKLEDILFEQQAIDEQARTMLHGLVERSQDKEGVTSSADGKSGVRESLTTVMTTLQQLSEIEDPELQESINEFLGGDSAGQTQAYEPKTYSPQYGVARFRFSRPLAEGGLGQVSVAVDLEFGREVAVKEIKTKYLDSAECHQRFKLESEIAARLEHPSIVPVYSRGINNQGSPFYAMQYIRGESMLTLIRKIHSSRSNLDAHAKLREIRKLIVRLVAACQAVHFANRKEVIHRDIKPHNIMLGKFGETFVVDWGLARTTKGNAGSSEDDLSVFIPSGSGSSETRQGSVIGTPEYMSPEQATAPSTQLGPASDVFGLGATLYCILTGSHPKSANSEYRSKRLDYGNFLRPSEVNSYLPKTLDAICMKALETEISQRYQTAAELMEDLEAWLADEPVNAYSEPLLLKARRWLKRHQTLATTIVGVAFTTIVALFALLMIMKSNQKALTIAKDEAVASEAISRQLLLKELRLDQQMLSKNELTFAQIAEYRLLVTQGAFEAYERWYKRNPNDRTIRDEFCFVARALSNLEFSAGMFALARVYLDTALTVHRATPLAMKTNEEKLELLQAEIDSSELDTWLGQLDRGLLSTMHADEILQSVSEDALEKPKRLRLSVIISLKRAIIQSEIGEHANAEILLKRCEAQLEELMAQSPDDHELKLLYATARRHRVSILQATDDAQSALKLGKAVLEEARHLGENSTKDAKQAWISMLSLVSEISLANSLDTDHVDTLIRVSVLDAERLKGPTANYQALEIKIRVLRGVNYRVKEDIENSVKELKQARQDAEKLVTRLRIPRYLMLLAEADWELSKTYRTAGDIANAKASNDAATKSIQNAQAISPQFRPKLMDMPKTIETR